MSIDVNTLFAAIDAIDDSLVLEFSDTESLKKEFGQKNKRRKVNFKKLLLAAVISALLVVAGLFAVSSSDNDSILDLKEGIYSIFGNSVSINVEDLDKKPEEIKYKSGEMIDILEKEGFTDIVLPTALLTDEWGIVDYEHTRSDVIIYNHKINFNMTNNCTIRLDEHRTEQTVGYSNSVAKNIQSLTVSGIDVVVTELENGICKIDYTVLIDIGEGMFKESQYRIHFQSGITFEQALEIAKTIA